MLRLLGAWGAAVAVWLLGFAVVARLIGPAGTDDQLSDVERYARLDIPWIVISALMVLAAGVVHRDTTRRGRWLLGVLLIPGVVILAGGIAGLGGQTSLPTAMSYVAEGVAGAALGLVPAYFFGSKEEKGAEYW